MIFLRDRFTRSALYEFHAAMAPLDRVIFYGGAVIALLGALCGDAISHP